MADKYILQVGISHCPTCQGFIYKFGTNVKIDPNSQTCKLDLSIVSGSLSDDDAALIIENVLDTLVEVGNDPYKYSSNRYPSMKFEGTSFSGL